MQEYKFHKNSVPSKQISFISCLFYADVVMYVKVKTFYSPDYTAPSNKI